MDFFYKFKVPNAVMYKTLPPKNDSLTCINQCHSGSVFERANKSNVHKIIHKSNIALTISAWHFVKGCQFPKQIYDTVNWDDFEEKILQI